MFTGKKSSNGNLAAQALLLQKSPRMCVPFPVGKKEDVSLREIKIIPF